MDKKEYLAIIRYDLKEVEELFKTIPSDPLMDNLLHKAADLRHTVLYFWWQHVVGLSTNTIEKAQRTISKINSNDLNSLEDVKNLVDICYELIKILGGNNADYNR